jgi:uncharacterized protein with NRDE domain
MCLIAMAWGVNAQYPLVIASNRDEFYARPTAPLAEWTTESGHTVYSGLDLEGGGTWLGFAQNGRFAMLTNVRNPAAVVPVSAPSRGALVMDWLTSQHHAAPWWDGLHASRYAGFNLIIGDWVRQECHYVSNQHLTSLPVNSDKNVPLDQWNIAQQAIHNVANKYPLRIQSGQIVGLSNAALNTPWPKTLHLVKALGDALSGTSRPGDTGFAGPASAVSLSEKGHGQGDSLASPSPQHISLPNLQEALQLALLNEEMASVDELPHTGVPPKQERALSSAFVRYPPEHPVYGTRTSMVAVLSAQRRLHLLETTHPVAQQAGGEVSLSLDWPL